MSDSNNDWDFLMTGELVERHKRERARQAAMDMVRARAAQSHMMDMVANMVIGESDEDRAERQTASEIREREQSSPLNTAMDGLQTSLRESLHRHMVRRILPEQQTTLAEQLRMDNLRRAQAELQDAYQDAISAQRQRPDRRLDRPEPTPEPEPPVDLSIRATMRRRIQLPTPA